MIPPTPNSNGLLVQLAGEISSNAAILSEHIRLNDLPQPSFDADGPVQIPQSDETVAAARTALIDATRALTALAVGPAETNRLFCFNELYLLGAMQVLCHFNVPQNVPLSGEIELQELSHKTTLPASLLARLIRMASANYYFTEPRSGFVAHTSFSKMLASDETLRATVWFRHAEMLPAVSKLVEMVERFPDSPEPGDTAFKLAFGDTFFDYKEKHPQHMVKFGQFVNAFASGEHGVADSAESIARAYPWGELSNDSLVVDVGGGVGHIAAAIAQAHPHLRFEVQDFGDLKAEAEAVFRQRGVEGRVKFRAHNFFEGQPADTKGARVYFLRNIFHNWSDLYCRRILKPLVEAMGPESRIVVCEVVLPQAGTVPQAQERIVRALDLTMLSMFNAKERSYEDWQALFRSVDERLGVVDVVGRPRMKRDGLIDARLTGP